MSPIYLHIYIIYIYRWVPPFCQLTLYSQSLGTIVTHKFEAYYTIN